MKTLLKTLTAAAALSATLSATPADARVEWQTWGDVDGPNGSGDFEKRWNFYDRGWSACVDPVNLEARARWDASDAMLYDMNYIWNRTYGFACVHSQNAVSCGDYEVRFACSVGAPTAVPDAGFGQALHFDGVDDRLRIFDPLEGLTDATIELRVMRMNSSAASLVQLADSDVIRFNAAGRLEVVLADGSALTSDRTLDVAAWAHVAVVQDSAAGEVRLFVDGELVGSTAGSLALDGRLSLGYDGSGAGAHFWGSVDELRLFDVARTEDEISTQMRLMPDSNGLRVHLGFDEAEGLPINAVDAADSMVLTGDPARVSRVNRVLTTTDDSGAFTVPDDVWSGDSDFSFSTWVKRGDSNVGVILQRNGSTVLNFATDGTLVSWIGGQLRSSFTVPTDTWAHVAYTWDQATQTGSIYINGTQAGQRVGALGQTGGSLSVAYDAYDHRDATLTGHLNDVRFFNATLSAAELTAQMTTRLSGNEANLTAAYRLDENAGTTAVDVTGRHDGTFIDAPAWTELHGGEGDIVLPYGTTAGVVPGAGEGLTIELVDTTSRGTLTLAADGSFTYDRTSESQDDSFTYRVTDGVTTSTETTVKLLAFRLELEITEIQSFPLEDIVAPDEGTYLTVDIGEPLRSTLIDTTTLTVEGTELSSTTLNQETLTVHPDPDDELTTVTFGAYEPGDAPLIIRDIDQDPADYLGTLNVILGDASGFRIEFEGSMTFDADGDLETMNGTATLGGASNNLLSGLGNGGTFSVGYDYPANFDDFELPLDASRKYIYFVIQANDSLSWGSHSISAGIGGSIMVLDHIDPAFLAYSEAFGSVNNYLNAGGLGLSWNGNFQMQPLVTWGNEDLFESQSGHFWFGGNGNIPIAGPLNLNVDGEVLVQASDIENADISNIFGLIDSVLANGTFGLNVSAGPYSLDWTLSHASYQYNQAADRHVVSGVLDDEQLVLIPDVVEIDLPGSANVALHVEGDEVQHIQGVGTFEAFGIEYTMEFSGDSDGGTMSGSVGLGASEIAISGGYDAQGFELTGSFTAGYSDDILGAISVDGAVTVSNTGGGIGADVSACLPAWLGGGCVTVSASINDTGSGYQACAALPAIGNKCFSL